MGLAKSQRASVCPVETGLDLISGRWKARILWKLYQGTMRYGELRRALPGITEKMLARQLRELERDQLVIRTQYPEVPPRVEYALSEFGETMRPILEALREWGMANNTRLSAIVDGGSEADKVSD